MIVYAGMANGPTAHLSVEANGAGVRSLCGKKVQTWGQPVEPAEIKNLCRACARQHKLGNNH